VTVYELFCGVEKAQNPAQERQKVERFLSVIIELSLDRTAAQAAARIRGDLERKGTPIGPYDLLIAGHALAQNLTLITHNRREFQRVTGLKLESWP
jgi:tRNA(fMet)-specific endonuclease VapC